MRKALIIYILSAAMAGCTPAAKAPVMTLGEAPVLDGGTYSTGGGITLAAEVVPLGGQTALCGVWAESQHQSVLSKGSARRVLHTGSAYLNGQVLHRDLAFMAQVPPATSYAGLEANCVQTAMPWTGGGTLTLRIPTQVVHREINDNDGASIIVTFRQTGPGTHEPTLKSLILGK